MEPYVLADINLRILDHLCLIALKTVNNPETGEEYYEVSLDKLEHQLKVLCQKTSDYPKHYQYIT